MIRSNPGIKTKELSEKTEFSPRTVQRYISTLQAAGEWIEYDAIQYGWKLQYEISILFDGHLKGILDYDAENEEELKWEAMRLHTKEI